MKPISKRVFLPLLLALPLSVPASAFGQLELPWEKKKDSGKKGAGPSLIAGGDFSPGSGARIVGDGTAAKLEKDGDAENAAWKLTGPTDMGISFAVAPAAEPGSLVVSLQVRIPLATTVQPEARGIRLRLRMMDRYQSSAVSDRLLQPTGSWQSVEQEFEDTGSGPYQLGIEAIGFTGDLYLDDVAVHKKSAVADPAGQPLEQWVSEQAWFKQLAEKMPTGVTLGVTVSADGERGWEEVEVREFHSPKSGFDPGVAPVVGRFAISSDRREVRWLNPLSGEMESVDSFLRSRD